MCGIFVRNLLTPALNTNCSSIDTHCKCKSGFVHNGKSCVDVDECATGHHNCPEFATCTNKDAGFECSCLEGFTGNDYLCTDLDECETSVHQCDSNAQCVNNIGSYACECKPF